MAGDRGWFRRGARRGPVAAPRRGPARLHHGSTASVLTRRRCASCAGRSAPTSPTTPATCSAPASPTGRPRPRRRSVRWRASAGPRRAQTAGWCRGCSERDTLAGWIPKLIALNAEELAHLPGVSPSRTHQIVPGAPVAEACMDIFDPEALEICPWALREGVILERLDQISVLSQP
ncbi:Ppx/GppA phosphatase family protein [Nocardioides sp. B-3]|uniref:Ppx/GppA phosphatase family protein n=1 Tax=Nocardioides sp. B-3 TaxID=2895565 RepID=UPI002152EAEE|nr:hypothetical protein [Nocardioides sp. B-3]UUZ61619.1 hypothetical protein LP418_08520 [Nocardioides sp. B-3]